MAARTIGVPVDVRDNGVRSFIPPSFSFDLVTVSGQVIETVSAVAVRAPGLPSQLQDFDVAMHLSAMALMALGEISEYDAGPQAREPGRRFTVTKVVPRNTVLQPGSCGEA